MSRQSVTLTAVVASVGIALSGVVSSVGTVSAVETQITTSATEHDFGAVQIGSSATFVLNVINGGADNFGPINFFKGSVSPGDFSGVQTCQWQTLLPGGSCTATYIFAPTAVGPASVTSAFVITETINEVDGEEFSLVLSGCGYVESPDECIAIVTTSTSTSTTTSTTTTTTTTEPATTTTDPPGDDGCTPGYWKNHTDSWLGYSPGQSTSAVFPGASAYGLGSQTLLQSLQGGGGSGTTGAARILLRAGTAALLNASHSGVDYTQSAADVTAAVNAALDGGSRDAMLALASSLDCDNNLGCPLN